MKKLFLFLSLFSALAANADVKISDLPLGVASTSGSTDPFPYVDIATNTTKRLKLSDIVNVPTMTSKFALKANLASPVFSGIVTAPLFSGALSGNASTATALAANPTDCSTDNFAYAIAASGNLTCSTVPDAGLTSSYIYANGSRGLSSDWNAGAHNITASTFIGALTGNAATATSATSATTATNATNTAITDDTTTNATMYPTWVTAATGNLPQKVSSTKLSFNPSTGALTATTHIGALTGTASGNTTYTANNHGMVVSSSTNAMTVVAPDADTTKVWTSGGTSADPSWQAPASAPTQPDQLTNQGMAATVAANALTIALKQADGSTNPSTGNASVTIAFRSSTATSGAYNVRSVTGALSLVVPSTATLGTSNGVAAYLWVYALDNAGTVELGVSQKLFSDYSVQSSTTIAGGSNVNNLIYSTTGRSNVPIRTIGQILISEATAGTWASAPTNVALTREAIADYYNVSARYVTTAGQSISTSGLPIVNFDTKDFDTHSAVAVGGSWVFTCPIAGKYLVSSLVSFASSAWVANPIAYTQVNKNASLLNLSAFFKVMAAFSDNVVLPSTSTLVNLAAGDTVNVLVNQNSGGSKSLETAAGYNWIEIHRVGN